MTRQTLYLLRLQAWHIKDTGNLGLPGRECCVMSIISCFKKLLSMISCNHDNSLIHLSGVFNIPDNPSHNRVIEVNCIPVTVKERMALVNFCSAFLYMEIIYLFYYWSILFEVLRKTIGGMRGIKKHEGEEWLVFVSVIQKYPEEFLHIGIPLISCLSRDVVFNGALRYLYKSGASHFRISEFSACHYLEIIIQFHQ